MPDWIDRIIRSVRESRGVLSGKLRAEQPILERAQIANEVVRTIREEFPWTGANERPHQEDNQRLWLGENEDGSRTAAPSAVGGAAVVKTTP